MNRDLLQQHFEKSVFDDMQSDALAAVFEQYREEMATKHDVALLRSEMKGDMAFLRAELKGDMASLRSEMGALRSEVAAGMSGLRTEMATMKADLTWRLVALVTFFATVMTLVGIFAG